MITPVNVSYRATTVSVMQKAARTSGGMVFVAIRCVVQCLAFQPSLRLRHKHRYLLATERARDFEVAHCAGRLPCTNDVQGATGGT